MIECFRMFVCIYMAGLACGIERVWGKGWEVRVEDIETSTLGQELRLAPQLSLEDR